MAEPANVMDIALMKRLLVKSKEEPVNAAIGLGDDGLGKLLLHKTKQSMSLGKQLEKDCSGLKNMRFGTALVDVDDDPKLVKIVVNRAVSGLGRKLAKTLKGTGFSKVLIMLEDGTVCEAHDDEEEGEGAAPVAGVAVAEPDAGAAMEPAAAPPDPAALMQRLRGLIERMKAALAGGGDRAGLMGLATAAQASLKAGAPGDAAGHMDALEAMLGSAAAPAAQPTVAPAPPAAGGAAVSFMKMRLLWDGTRKNLMDQLKTLEAAIVEQSAEEEDAEEIRANVIAVEEHVAALDERLSDALDNLYNAGGQDERLKQQARSIAEGYQSYVAGDPLMQELDANPFVPLDARKRLDATLSSLISRL